MRTGTRMMITGGGLDFLEVLDDEDADLICDLYLMILIAARSIRHLRHIHDEILPANYRLLRPELIELEGLWKKFHPDGNTPSDVPGVSEDVLRFLITSMTTDRCLIHYYLDHIAGKSDHKLAPDWTSHADTIFSWDGQHNGYFVTQLFDQECKLFCRTQSPIVIPRRSREDQDLIVSIRLEPAKLTEPLTHQLLSKMPPYSISYGNENNYSLDFHYIFPMADFIQDLNVVGDRSEMLVATPEFIANLELSLTILGIPLSRSISPTSNEPPKAHKMA